MLSIEIREAQGGKVITVIEFLSPANKSGGAGQLQYAQKQKEVLASDTSLVEIDLVRGGLRVLALPASEIPVENRHDYLVCISPGWMKGRRELYPLPLRRALPAIPIPLREAEPRVVLELQPLADRAYAVGRYDLTDCAADPDPPLETSDAAWAADLLRAVGRR
jgi:Protein of unknown function (DUF4058)